MKFGVQLYNFRVPLSEDFTGTLERIAEIGFDGVEFAYNFGEMTPSVLAEFLKKIGLECCGIMFKGDELKDPCSPAWEYASALNPPAVSISANTDFANKWREILDLCLDCAENSRKKGFLFSYHNHWAEFAPADGIPAMFRILDAPGAERIFAEPDVCWLTRGGMNPAEFIRKYAARIRQVHFKDIAVPDDPATTCPLGQGVIDLKSSYGAVKETGCEWIIYEQDNSSDPFRDAEESLAFLKQLN